MSETNRFYSDSPSQARVIYSRWRQEHYLKEYKEVQINANDITSEFLQELYLDNSITAYKFILQIQKRYNAFDKTQTIIYFYYLYN